MFRKLTLTLVGCFSIMQIKLLIQYDLFLWKIDAFSNFRFHLKTTNETGLKEYLNKYECVSTVVTVAHGTEAI